MNKNNLYKPIQTSFLFLFILFNLGFLVDIYGQNNDIHSLLSIRKDELVKRHVDSLVLINRKLTSEFCEAELLQTSFFKKPVLYSFLVYNGSISFFSTGETTKSDSLKNVLYSIGLDNIHPIIRGEILWYKTKMAFFYNDILAAIKYSKEAYLIFEKNDLPDLFGKTNLNLGQAYHSMDRNELSYSYFVNAQIIFKDANLQKEYAMSLLRIISLLDEMHRYDEILENLAIAEDIAIELEDQKLLASIYFGKGNYYMKRGGYANSLQFYKMAETTFQINQSYRELSLINTRRAFISIQSGDLEKAVDYNKIAANLRKKYESKFLRISSLLNIASTFIALEKYDSAVVYIQKGKDLAILYPNRPEFLRIMDLEIRIFMDRKQYEMAYSTLEKKMQAQDVLYKKLNEKRYDVVKSEYQMKKFEKYKELKQAEVEKYKTELERDQLIFRVIFGILILVMISSVILYFFNRIKNKRTLVQTSQKIIFIQLNSHFIFNALTAIQSLIFQKKIESAIVHLNVFSNLINKVIGGTQREYISLSNEITFIKDFLKLQELRFGDILKYEFNIDEALDIQKIMVPPMLIFPFIEYAIEECVQLSKGKGMFIINIRNDHDHIVYELIDRDLGFANLESCFIKRHAGQKILCAQLINERLSAYNTIFTKKINFTENMITLEEVNYKTLNFRTKK